MKSTKHLMPINFYSWSDAIEGLVYDNRSDTIKCPRPKRRKTYNAPLVRERRVVTLRACLL